MQGTILSRSIKIRVESPSFNTKNWMGRRKYHLEEDKTKTDIFMNYLFFLVQHNS